MANMHAPAPPSRTEGLLPTRHQPHHGGHPGGVGGGQVLRARIVFGKAPHLACQPRQWMPHLPRRMMETASATMAVARAQLKRRRTASLRATRSSHAHSPGAGARRCTKDAQRMLQALALAASMVLASSVFDNAAADAYLAALKMATGDVAAARARMMVDGYIRLDVPYHSGIVPSDALLRACDLRTSKMEGVKDASGLL